MQPAKLVKWGAVDLSEGIVEMAYNEADLYWEEAGAPKGILPEGVLTKWQTGKGTYGTNSAEYDEARANAEKHYAGFDLGLAKEIVALRPISCFYAPPQPQVPVDYVSIRRSYGGVYAVLDVARTKGRMTVTPGDSLNVFGSRAKSAVATQVEAIETRYKADVEELQSMLLLREEKRAQSLESLRQEKEAAVLAAKEGGVAIARNDFAGGLRPYTFGEGPVALPKLEGHSEYYEAMFYGPLRLDSEDVAFLAIRERFVVPRGLHAKFTAWFTSTVSEMSLPASLVAKEKKVLVVLVQDGAGGPYTVMLEKAVDGKHYVNRLDGLIAEWLIPKLTPDARASRRGKVTAYAREQLAKTSRPIYSFPVMSRGPHDVADRDWTELAGDVAADIPGHAPEYLLVPGKGNRARRDEVNKRAEYKDLFGALY